MEDFRQIIRECKALRDIYPWWPKESEFRKWTKFKVEIWNFKFHVASLDTRQVSRHYTIVINDDLVNDDNAYSDTERERVKRKWKLQKSILTKSKKKGIGIEIDVGTPYHSQDLVAHIIKNVRKYDKFIMPYRILGADGKWILTFPEVFTWEDFEEIREDQGASIFATQYELNVIEESDRICQENWIRYFTETPAKSNRYLIVDMAGTEDKKRNDPTAYVVVDVDENGRLFILYAGQFWLAPGKAFLHAQTIAKTYRCDEVFFEKEKYTTGIGMTGEHLAPSFQFGYVEPQGRPKPKRIHRLKQFFELGRVFLAQGMRDFEDQLLSYPDTSHDDLLDALAYVLDVMVIPDRKYDTTRDEDRSGEAMSFEEEMSIAIAKVKEIQDAQVMDAYF